MIGPLHAACGSGEPSEKEMEAALRSELDSAEALTGKVEIVSFEKHECNELDSGEYRCTFTLATAGTNPFTGKPEETEQDLVGIFESFGGDRWTVREG